VQQARTLHHAWVGQDHLVLALFDPDCPGAASAVLRSFGVTVEPLQQVLIASMGDQGEPDQPGFSWSPAVQLLLERANLEAALLADAEVSSEHVLLALTRRWDGSVTTNWLHRRGLDPIAVRQRVVDLTEGVELPSEALLPALSEAELDPAPELDLAPGPNGEDPRRRRPWGSRVFLEAGGQPVRQRGALKQYFVDRDGNPILTADGQLIHVQIDELGNNVVDGEGRPLIGPVDVPPDASPYHGADRS
jgi:ATP-dependent Clp protease ATP-binding subunit ClpA